MKAAEQMPVIDTMTPQLELLRASLASQTYPGYPAKRLTLSELPDLDNNLPLHPWFWQMATDPSLGVITGKGFYRHFGANYTADSIVVSGNQILLVRRQDTGQWALPGGFVDEGETAKQAARRELTEETNIKISQPGKPIYRGPVADIRMTAHAWPETTALLYQIDEAIEPQAGDDAAEACWFSLDDLPEQLFGSHRYLLDLAINKLEEDN